MNTDALSNLVVTRVRSVSTMYSPQGKGAKRKNRPCWAVLIKYEGETVYTANGKRVLSDANHPVILPKGSSYEWECTRAGHFITVEFEGEPCHTELLGFSVKSGEKLLEMLRELERKRNLKHPMVEQESVRDLYGVILALAQTEPERYTPTEKQRQIAPAVEYLSQHYAEKLTNDALAALTGLSTVYFRKLFTHIMGTSPMAYARELRIAKAKEMLKSDYGTLGDVARSLGYASLYDFSRDFKKHVGVPPSAY